MQMWISNSMTIGCEAVAGGCGGMGQTGIHYLVWISVGLRIGTCFRGRGALVRRHPHGPTRRVDEGYNGDDARTEFQPNLADAGRDPHVGYVY